MCLFGSQDSTISFNMLALVERSAPSGEHDAPQHWSFGVEGSLPSPQPQGSGLFWLCTDWLLIELKKQGDKSNFCTPFQV